MKRVLALAVLLSSTASLAADRAINDIMYLPSAGTTYGISSVGYGQANIEIGTFESEISGFVVQQSIGHAFTDRLTLEAALDYTSLESDPKSGPTTDAAKGISDPKITARFRMIDEDFRWDLLGGAILAMSDREADLNTDASNNQHIDYDNHQGGNSLLLGTQFGAKKESFQWAIAGVLTRNFEAETEYEITGQDSIKVKDDAHTELLFQGDILNSLFDKTFLRTHVAVRFVEEYEDDQTQARKTPAATTYELGTEFQYLVSKDFLLRAGVDYAKVSTRSGQVDKWSGWTVNLGANYQF